MVDKTKINIYYARVLNLYSIPKREGVYVITHMPDNIHSERYVGSSSELYKRFYGHTDKNIVYIDLYVTDNLHIARSLEKVVIELVKPETNNTKPPLLEEDRLLLKELIKTNKIKDVIIDDTCKNTIQQNIDNSNIEEIEVRFLPLELDDRKRPYDMDEWKNIADECKRISKELSDMYFSLLEKYPKTNEHIKSLYRTRYHFTKTCESLEKDMLSYIKNNNIKYKDEYDKMFHPLHVVMTNY